MSSTPLRSPKVRELGDSVQELAKLTDHPSWKTLRKEFEKRRDGYLNRIARSLVAGGEAAEPIDQRKMDYIRGFLRGSEAVLDTPDNAFASLEKVLREERTNG